MLIKQIEVYKTDLELNGELHSAHTKYQVTEDVYLKIITNDDVTGFGSTAPKYYITGETQDTVITVLKKRIIPAVLGEDPFNLEKIHDKMDHAIKGNTAAKAAVDIALYDLMGKYLGVPVYRLLGGLYRSEMPAFDLIGLVTPEEAARRAARQLAAGYQEFKVKVGPNPPLDLKRVEAVSEAVKGVPLKVDANQSWKGKQAVYLTQRFAELGVNVVEQPVHMDDLEGLLAVKNGCPQVDVMADESIKSLTDALRLIKYQAVDLFNLKLVKTGGLYPAKKIAALAEAANMDCMAGCTVQNTLLDAATAHFLASTRNVVCNEIKSPQWIKDDIATGLKITAGKVVVPEGVGLGLEIDEERLASYRV
ncbi:MAG: mandelate racemase/muconate lactonizing enzyme family protein [Peptococcaceae bacterium]